MFQSAGLIHVFLNMRRSGNDPVSQRAAIDPVGHGQSLAMPESMLWQAEGNLLIEMRVGEDFPFG